MQASVEGRRRLLNIMSRMDVLDLRGSATLRLGHLRRCRPEGDLTAIAVPRNSNAEGSIVSFVNLTPARAKPGEQVAYTQN